MDTCSQYNIKQTFITAHHPASNGLERTNRNMLVILRHFAGHLHEIWQDWLSRVASSINCCVSSSTGKTPQFIIFGYDRRLPYDVLCNPPPPLRIILNYSFIASEEFLPLFARN